MEPDLSVEIAGLKLQNPVMVASGTFGFGEEYLPLVDVSRLGAIVVKSVTLRPTEGNRPPRVYETSSGMLNSIGLQNPGMEVFLTDKLPVLRRLDVPIIVNIAGKTVEEYVELAGRLDGVAGISALEVNISCPNVKEGGLAFGADPESAGRVTRAVRQETGFPLIVKLSPNVTDITAVARAVETGGADAVSLINTLAGMAIDAENRRPVLGNISGGLSGPAIKPLALYMVWRVSQAVRIPLIGMGGITNATDAVEFLLAGASAVAVGMFNFVEPTAAVNIAEGIKDYLLRHRIPAVRQLTGTLQTDQ